METPDCGPTQKCPLECPGCDSSPEPGAGGHSHALPNEQRPGGLVGWRLAAAAGITFLLPVVLGMAGAAWAGGGHDSRFAGAVAGVVAGVILAIAITRIFFRTSD